MPSRPVLLVSGSEVRALLGPGLARRLVLAGYRDLSRGQACCPPKQSLDLPGRGGPNWINSMPAVLPGSNAAGVKWVSVVGGNARRGLPVVQGTVLVSDARTGSLRAVVEGGSVTELRTGACAAAGALALRPRARRFAVLGTGRQARACLSALAEAYPVSHARVWGRDPGKARRLAASLSRETGWEMRPAASGRAAAAAADVVVCATSARRPLFMAAWQEPGQLIIGLTGLLDLDAALTRRSTVIFDDAAAGLKRLRQVGGGRLPRLRVGPELPDILRGRAAAPRGPLLLLVVGLGALDVALAQRAAVLAARRGLGRRWSP